MNPGQGFAAGAKRRSHVLRVEADAEVAAHATTEFNDGVAVIGIVGNSEHFGLNPFVLSAGLRFGF